MVHVAREACHDHESDVHHEKCQEAEHGEEVDGARRLTAAEKLRVPGEVIHHGRRHGDTGEDSQRAENEDHGKVGDLLQAL